MAKATTDRFRVAFVITFVGVIVAAVVGWLLGVNMDGLGGVLTAATAATGVGEASNIGKRATYRVDVMRAMREEPEPENGGGYVRPPDLELDPSEGDEG